MFVQINPLVAKLITTPAVGRGREGEERRRKGERERRERSLLYGMTVGEESIQSKKEGLISLRSDFSHFLHMGLKAETLKDGWGYVCCFRFIPFMSTFGAEFPLAEFQVKTDIDTFGDVSTHCKDTSTTLLFFYSFLFETMAEMAVTMLTSFLRKVPWDCSTT